jgi:hypothetical protein
MGIKLGEGNLGILGGVKFFWGFSLGKRKDSIHSTRATILKIGKNNTHKVLYIYILFFNALIQTD